jgi:D-lactate dehydrogenase (cytochrome)/glycolate oxidase
VRAAVGLGGTITGEHGVGTLKVPYLANMVGDAERALMARVKAAFDPAGILNPGKAI